MIGYGGGLDVFCTSEKVKHLYVCDFMFSEQQYRDIALFIGPVGLLEGQRHQPFHVPHRRFSGFGVRDQNVYLRHRAWTTRQLHVSQVGWDSVGIRRGIQHVFDFRFLLGRRFFIRRCNLALTGHGVCSFGHHFRGTRLPDFRRVLDAVTPRALTARLRQLLDPRSRAYCAVLPA